MRQVLWFASLLLCLSLLPRLAAQDSDSPSTAPFGHKSAKYPIRGTLRDASTDRGAGGIKVELREPGGATVASTYTSDSGGFSFSEVRSGSYEISVVEVGYQPIDQQVSADDSAFALELWLRKAKDQPGGSRGPTVSVRELSVPRKAHEDMLKGVNLLYQKNDYRGSIEQFQRAIKEYPGYYEAYAQMAVAYVDLSEAANAEDALKKSIDASQQSYSEAYFALAGLYLDDKRFSDAEPLARKAAELDGASWKGHYELASALFGLDRFPEAEAEAKTAVERQPDGAEMDLLLADIHIHLQNYSAVLDDVNAYLKLDPSGTHADEARRLREQIQTAMQKTQEAADKDCSRDSEDTPAEEQAPDSQ